MTATVRALCALHGHALAPDELAEMVLAVEVEDLGIAAGPQDRYAQAHEGLVLMDFAGARPRVERLDPALLPSLYLAWRSDAAEASHAVHGGLRERARRAAPCGRGWRGSPATRARRAHALLGGDHAAFAAALDASFDERAALLDLDPRHEAMVHAARAAGASANYAGPAARSSVLCLLTASSPSLVRCARWTARSSRRASAPRTRLAPSHGDRPKGSSPCQSQALTTFSRPSTRRSTASRRGRSASCPSSRSASSAGRCGTSSCTGATSPSSGSSTCSRASA